MISLLAVARHLLQCPESVRLVMCRLRLRAVGQAEPGLCGPGQAGPYFRPHAAFGPASYYKSLSRRLRPRLLGTKCPNFFEVDIWVLSLRRCTAAAVTRNPGHVMYSSFADDGHASQVLLFPSSASSRQPWTSRGASGAPSSSTPSSRRLCHAPPFLMAHHR